MSKKVTVIFAHPHLDKSRANKKIIEKISGMKNVTIRNLYKEYPDFKIDVKREQKLLVDSDLIVFQFPFYWYSSPALLKEWEDAVLEYGFAYGSTGKALHGKDFCVIVTIGGPEEAYTKEGWNKFPADELLRPFEQTANLCGMKFLNSFKLHGVPNIPGLDIGTVPGIDVKKLDEKIDNHAKAVREFLESYQEK